MAPSQGQSGQKYKKFIRKMYSPNLVLVVLFARTVISLLLRALTDSSDDVFTEWATLNFKQLSCLYIMHSTRHFYLPGQLLYVVTEARKLNQCNDQKPKYINPRNLKTLKRDRMTFPFHQVETCLFFDKKPSKRNLNEFHVGC